MNLFFSGTQNDLVKLCWPTSKLDQALEQIGLQTGLTGLNQFKIEDSAIIFPNKKNISQWIMNRADQLGMLAESVSLPYAQVETMLSQACPALLQIGRSYLNLHSHNHDNFPVDEDLYLVAISGGSRLTIIAPDMSRHRVNISDIRAAWCHSFESAYDEKLNAIWNELALTDRARTRASEAVMKAELADLTITGCWLFHPPPNVGIGQQMKRYKVGWLIALMLVLNLLQQATTFGGWAIIGQSSFEGRFDRGWLAAWVIIMFTGVLFQAATFDLQGPLATKVLRVIKSRVLYGALQTQPDEVRHQGSGQFFGRVLESDMVQNFLVGGALIALPFAIMLVLSGVTLWFGAGGWIHTLLLILWTLFAGYVGWRRLIHGTEGLRIYRNMTNELVENMIGHRTRLAQESRTHWHHMEDAALAQYTDISRYFDWNGVQLDVLIPRGWLVLGLVGIARPFVLASASTATLAISIGGILFAQMAFESLAQAMKFLAQSIISWQQIAPLLEAADRKEVSSGQTDLLPSVSASEPKQDHQPVIMMRNLTFRYHKRSKPILKECNLTIHAGEQYLLEGSSGGGKSTLASVLSGLRTAESGLLLLWGFDTHTVGNSLWRQRVATAPQFQENHIFTDTLAFNLLLGRGFPPSEADLEDAEQICRELGLGNLIDRMPDGLDQLIGDGGWQVSYGERSRIYIARALLQNADLVILDESFGALDPESLRQAMECVLRWVPTLIVIAHP